MEHLRKRRAAISLILLLYSAGICFAQVSLDLSINARECYTGESLTLQALVSGSDQVEVGKLPEPSWGTITYQGGQTRNSTSVTSINGRVTRVEEKGFLMSFQITPEITGQLTVPEISFTADGEELRSSAFTITVKAPETSDDYDFEISLPVNKVYPGQEFTAVFKWYYRKGARDLSFLLPFLDEFEFLGQEPVSGRSYEVTLNNLNIQAAGGGGIQQEFRGKGAFYKFLP